MAVTASAWLLNLTKAQPAHNIHTSCNNNPLFTVNRLTTSELINGSFCAL